VITGHLGIAGIARTLQRDRFSSIALLALVLTSLAPDVLDILYAALGVCNPYGLYSHTLHAVVLQAAVIGGAAFLATGSLTTAACFASVVLLHVAGDFFTGQKLLLPGGEIAGFKWYDRPVRDFFLEIPILVIGWWMLRRSDRAPRWAASSITLGLLLLLQTSFDVYAATSNRGIKPNSCFSRSPAQQRATLVVSE
jgi:hypothetical protein